MTGFQLKACATPHLTESLNANGVKKQAKKGMKDSLTVCASSVPSFSWLFVL